MNKFVEIEGKDIEYKLENAWYQQCRQKQVPFIKINSKRKFADVHWDYITYSTDLDALLSKTADEFSEAATEIFKKYASQNSSCDIDVGLVWFYNLEIPKARLAASELYDLLVNRIEIQETNK